MNNTVDSTGDVGVYTSLRLTRSDYPCVSYYDTTNGDLKYAAWNGSAWTIRVVDSTGDVGMYTSLRLNSSDYPAISYFDTTNADLKYAAWNGSAWTVQTVDDVGNIGKYTSLAFNSFDYPCISYYDTPNGNLKYAAWDGTGWMIQTVDIPNNVGSYTSLELDSSNNPCISYYDTTNGDLKYAAWNGAGWIIQTVDSVGIVGMYTSLALDSSDNPRISYYDTTNGDLKYAAWNGAGWVLQTVDSTGNVGMYTSIALDHSNFPVISNYDTTNGDLKYAAWNGAGWIIRIIDSTGNVGKYSSIVAGNDDTPRSGYYDVTNGDLKYAKGEAVVAGFTAASVSGTPPLTVSFTDTSTGTPDGWTWYFGDGGISTVRNPLHTYTAVGTYTVYLTARDSFSNNTSVRVGYIAVTSPGGGSGTTGPLSLSDNGGSSSDSDNVSPPVMIPDKTTDLYVKLHSDYFTEHKVVPADIVIMSYGRSGWEALPTTFVYSSGNEFYFTADADRYSLLAIGNTKEGVRGLPLFIMDQVSAAPSPVAENSVTKAEFQTGSESHSGQHITSIPVTVETTAAPMIPSTEPAVSPLMKIAFIGAGVIGIMAGGMRLRRWWIRRQNPALFREYD